MASEPATAFSGTDRVVLKSRAAAGNPEVRFAATFVSADPMVYFLGAPITHRARLLTKWGGYCKALFTELATQAPGELVQILEDRSIPASRRTFAAEILGRVNESDVVVGPLLELLDHPSRLIREGAVYGLSWHATPEVRTRLQALVTEDPSPAVRQAAQETLTTD